MKAIVRILSLAMVVALMGPAARAADNRFGGAVKDASGAAIAGAVVRVVSRSGFERVTTSGRDGTFAIEELPEGAYLVEVSAPGFRRSVLELGESRELEVTLEPAGVAEVVTVTAADAPQSDGEVAKALSVVSRDETEARGEIALATGSLAFDHAVNGIWSYTARYSLTDTERVFESGAGADPVIAALVAPYAFDADFDGTPDVSGYGTSLFEGRVYAVDVRNRLAFGARDLLTVGFEAERESYFQYFSGPFGSSRGAYNVYGIDYDFDGVKPAFFGSRLFIFDGYARADLSASYAVPVTDRVSVTLFGRVDNLTDTEILENGIRVPGATGYGRLKLRF